MRLLVCKRNSLMEFMLVIFLIFQLTNTSFQIPVNMSDDWSTALPFNRKLEVLSPLMKGKDVVILQNLLQRYPGINLTANGEFDQSTKDAVTYFQKEINIIPSDGVVNIATGTKVIERLMSDGYKDDGKIPDWCKYKLYVPVYRDRTIETTAILYARNGDVLYKFTVRARGGTSKEGQILNQLTTNGDTPTGLSTFDLNSKEPEKYVKSFGPYPVLRCVKGMEGNAAIGKDDYIGPDGKDTFLSDYRSGILLHTGIWEDWDKSKPMPNSLGCMHTSLEDMKAIDEILVNKTGAVVNENPFGKLPYPYKEQGIISVEQLD